MVDGEVDGEADGEVDGELHWWMVRQMVDGELHWWVVSWMVSWMMQHGWLGGVFSTCCCSGAGSMCSASHSRERQ